MDFQDLLSRWHAYLYFEASVHVEEVVARDRPTEPLSGMDADALRWLFAKGLQELPRFDVRLPMAKRDRLSLVFWLTDFIGQNWNGLVDLPAIGRLAVAPETRDFGLYLLAELQIAKGIERPPHFSQTVASVLEQTMPGLDGLNVFEINSVFRLAVESGNAEVLALLWKHVTAHRPQLVSGYQATYRVCGWMDSKGAVPHSKIVLTAEESAEAQKLMMDEAFKSDWHQDPFYVASLR